MPESVSSVGAILDGLRGEAIRPDARSITQFAPFVMLDHAEAAVHAAADARTQEIVDALNDGTPHDAFTPAVDDPAEWIARRFPNGGTPDAD